MSAAPQNSAPSRSAGKGEKISKPKTKTRKIALLGTSLAIVGGLGAYALTLQDTPQQVLSIKSDISRGQTITEESLTTVNIKDANSGTIRVEDRRKIIGKKATKDISAGQLILTQDTTDSLTLPEGQELIGVVLPETNTPSRPLKTGDRVTITAPAQDGGGNPAQGKVDTVTTTKDGYVKIDVFVPTDTSNDRALMEAIANKKAVVALTGNSEE